MDDEASLSQIQQRVRPPTPGSLTKPANGSMEIPLFTSKALLAKLPIFSLLKCFCSICPIYPVFHICVERSPMEIKDLADLRSFVQQKLCDQNELERDAFQMTERILIRGTRPCGILFCLHGPRSVKLTAIWETQHNTILFYGSRGERQYRAYLRRGPRLVMRAL